MCQISQVMCNLTLWFSGKSQCQTITIWKTLSIRSDMQFSYAAYSQNQCGMYCRNIHSLTTPVSFSSDASNMQGIFCIVWNGLGIGRNGMRIFRVFVSFNTGNAFPIHAAYIPGIPRRLLMSGTDTWSTYDQCTPVRTLPTNIPQKYLPKLLLPFEVLQIGRPICDQMT